MESAADNLGAAERLRLKIRQLYAFLKEANQLQFRPVRRLMDQPHLIRLSEMPLHPSVQLYRPVKGADSVEMPDVLLRVSRPRLTRCPEPPEKLSDWLLPGWDDPRLPPSVIESRNETHVELDQDAKEIEVTVSKFFSDDPARVSAFESWLRDRSLWSEAEVIARDAMKFFENLYALYSKVEKDNEKLELMIGDGILSWRAESAVDGDIQIQHPILLKRVELRFNPSIPEFTVHDTDREVELYGNIFIDLKGVDVVSIRRRKEELEQSAYHPLGWEDTSAFLKAFALTISPTLGEYLDQPGDGSTSNPRIWRDAVLFLRHRTAGIANAVDKILDHIDERPSFPHALTQIAGEESTAWTGAGLSLNSCDEGSTPGWGLGAAQEINSTDVLLVNEANNEQLEIVKRLNRSGSVVVQGPPGTGKTHTISNLIGHLLSEGKSILVTAHTAKALRVLRDKVPAMLQPLCVSVLGSDQLARRQLEASIGSITERLTSETYDGLLRKGKGYEDERRTLIERHRTLTHLLREAIENEYKSIEIGQATFSPADAARFVSQERVGNDWIPSPVDVTCPIDSYVQDVEALYRLGASFDTNEEADSRSPLPNLSELPTEKEFCSLVADYQALLIQDLSQASASWGDSDKTAEELSTVQANLLAEFDDELLTQSWRPYAIIAGMHGQTELDVWTLLIAKIESAVDASAKYSLMLHHRAVLSEQIPIHRQYELLNQICAHLEGGGKLGFVQLATRSEWRNLIKTVRVAAGEPTHLEHFRGLRQLADIQAQRMDLEELWNALIGNRVGKTFQELGSSPEQVCRSLIPEIRRCLLWFKETWKPLEEKLRSNGLKIDELLSAIPREPSEVSEYTTLEKFAKTQLIEIVEREVSRRKLREIEAQFNGFMSFLSKFAHDSTSLGCVAKIVRAIDSRDPSAYAESLSYLQRVQSIKLLVSQRDAAIASLQKIAPTWANAIAQRVAPHDQSLPPGDISRAWRWRQLADILDERSKLDASQIQGELESVSEMLREATRLLVDAKSWSQQLKRLQSDNSMRQALVGWLDTAKRLASTRQMDKRQTLLIEARRLMKRCAASVPVWIMPISIMAESFDPKTTKFDVVIIDEASQADINALIPLYMGSQIIVVGDHEQVTPLGVGKDQTLLENLRRSMLRDIPNSHLYDNMSSIYDLARQSFGEGVRLVEHFRCVPQIISFSNALSYEGKIKPLREASSSFLKPACVPLRVNGIREGDTNMEEARSIVSYIKAMIRHEAYRGKTIGVISMLGDSQAVLIQSLIHKEVESVEIESRRIQSGISGEFQGDERDVIFLSMVDSATDTTPLRMTGEGAYEQTKKRYNVAASRARDQLWVVHSFDPDLHLKAADLRYRLLQHVRDPDSSIRNYEQEVVRVESPFEKEVLKRLTAAGYRVRTQVEVGYFRIDMVVEGGSGRLAVECDGDRYHPIEKLAEDMNRQAILERLGWRFSRIRGSSFYRNPDKAMEAVFRRLNELEIFPAAELSNGGGEVDRQLIVELNQIIDAGFADELTGSGTSDQVDGSAEAEAVEEAHRRSADAEFPPDSFVQSEQTHDQEVSGFSASSDRGLTVRSRYGLFEYVYYQGPPCTDPRIATADQIREDFLRIVTAEGPIQVKRACDIQLRSCGIKRMGPDLRAALLRALEELKGSAKLSSHNYLGDADVLNDVVWLSGKPAESLRQRGDRSLEEIPVGELHAISLLVASLDKLDVGSELHFRKVLEVLELKRLTANAETILRHATAGAFNKIVEA